MPPPKRNPPHPLAVRVGDRRQHRGLAVHPLDVSCLGRALLPSGDPSISCLKASLTKGGTDNEDS